MKERMKRDRRNNILQNKPIDIKPVFNKSANCTVRGKLGGGMSYSSIITSILAASRYDKVIMYDPKKEYKRKY